MGTNNGDYSLNSSAYNPLQRVGQGIEWNNVGGQDTSFAQLLSKLSGNNEFDYREGANNIDLIGADSQGNFAPEGVKPAGFMDGFGLSDAFSAGTDILGAWTSLQGAKEGRKLNKQATAMSLANLANQAKTTNASLHDRQQARVAMDPNAMGVADYMEKFGVSGTV